LADQRHPGTLDALDEGCRIAERQRHCRGTAFECHVKQRRMLGHAPGNESYSDPTHASRFEFAGQPLGVSVATTDETQTASGANRRDEQAAGNKVHRRQQYRVPRTHIACGDQITCLAATNLS
jgi:hypothetical protein